MSEKVKIGIIGTGSISNLHMAAYRKLPDAEVVACCDLNEERAKKYAEKYGIPHVFTDYRELLKMKEIDAVSVTTWNNGHAPISIAALRAGKNVLCEKPMALNTKEALEMKKTAEETGKLLMIGFVRRFGQNTEILKDFMKAGRIGDIYHIDVKCVRRAGNPCGWFSDKSRSGGGPVIDLGVHMIDLGYYLMNKPKAVSVYAATFNPLGTRLNIKACDRYRPADFSSFCNVEDKCVAMIRFENDAVLTLEVSFSDNIEGEEISVQIHGTKGGAVFEPKLKLFTEMDDYLVDVTPVYSEVEDSFAYNFSREIRHFVSCVKGGETCINTAEDGVNIMRILESIYLSADRKHEVVLAD